MSNFEFLLFFIGFYCVIKFHIWIFFEDFSKLTFIVYFGIQLFYSINNEASHMLKTFIFLTFYFQSCFLVFHIFEDGGEDIWRTVHLINLKFAVHICATNLNNMNAEICCAYLCD